MRRRRGLLHLLLRRLVNFRGLVIGVRVDCGCTWCELTRRQDGFLGSSVPPTLQSDWAQPIGREYLLVRAGQVLVILSIARFIRDDIRHVGLGRGDSLRFLFSYLRVVGVSGDPIPRNVVELIEDGRR